MSKAERALSGSQGALPGLTPSGAPWSADEYETPAAILSELAAEFGPFDIDPCATADNAKAPHWADRERDGLALEWWGRVFMNPPYSECAAWVAKARSEVDAGRASVVVCLLPVRTDQRWWHQHVEEAATVVRFLPYRVCFERAGEPVGRPPFASVVVIFGGV